MSSVANLMSVDQAVAALPVRKSRRWLVNFLRRTPTDPAGNPLYRLFGRDKLVYMDRVIFAITGEFSEDTPAPKPKQPLPSRRLVYFLECDGHVKIGWTRGDIKKRIRSLATGQHREFEVLAVIENANGETETELHQRFAKYHVRGEWFVLSPSILDYVQKLRREGIAR